MSCLRSLLATVAAASLATSTTSEPACYRIDGTAECPHQYEVPEYSECMWGNGWERLGPYWETFVTSKTLLLTPGASGMTCETRKCRRVYVMIKENQVDQKCYSAGYGDNASFINTSCVVGSGSGS